MSTKVYIDGQNFMYKAADILIEAGKIKHKDELTKINIRAILEQIFGSDIELSYYSAKVNVRRDKGKGIEKKSRRFSDVSRRIRNTLNAQNIAYVESGKLKLRDGDECKKCKHQDLHFQEKGVDVGLAVDMVVDALAGTHTKQVVVSSDTDLLPAIKIARSSGSVVVYVGFSNKTTKAIVAEASETEIIRDNEILSAYKEMNTK